MAIYHNPLHAWQFITINCMHGSLSQSTTCMAVYHNPLHMGHFCIIIIPGYQEDDIVPEDPRTYQLVMGHKVLDENGEEKVEHKYVFAPDGKHTTLFNVYSRLLQLSRKKWTRLATSPSWCLSLLIFSPSMRPSSSSREFLTLFLRELPPGQPRC